MFEFILDSADKHYDQFSNSSVQAANGIEEIKTQLNIVYFVDL